MEYVDGRWSASTSDHLVYVTPEAAKACARFYRRQRRDNCQL